MIQKAPLSKTAQNGLRELRSKYGITPDPEEIVWLHRLGERVEDPRGRFAGTVLDMPTKAGNTWLCPLSRGAEVWLEDYGAPAFDGDPIGERDCRLFAHAYSHDPETLLPLQDYRTVRKAVRKWARRLAAGDSELNAALRRLMHEADPPDPDQEDKPPVVWLEILAALEHAYPGENEQTWTWAKSSRWVLALMACGAAKTLADGEQIEKGSPEWIAVDDFARAMAEIARAHGVGQFPQPEGPPAT